MSVHGQLRLWYNDKMVTGGMPAVKRYQTGRHCDLMSAIGLDDHVPLHVEVLNRSGEKMCLYSGS